MGVRRAVGVVACLVLLLAEGTPAARANHTPMPGTVALVGSLQSELGCPGDWQPECPQTRLAPVAGSPGLFRGTFDVPPGSYEYKVARNGSWDENYGAGGAPGGANIPITAPGVIVMVINGRRDGVVVVFNASPGATSQIVPSLAGRCYALHPVQAHGGDPVVRTSTYQAGSGTFTVPARTVAVFERRHG